MKQNKWNDCDSHSGKKDNLKNVSGVHSKKSFLVSPSQQEKGTLLAKVGSHKKGHDRMNELKIKE